MTNAEMVKRRISELGLDQKVLAQELGIAQSTLSQKINNVRVFDINEALKLSELLRLPSSEIPLYFFVK